MGLAIEEARRAEGHGDVPIGAVVARDGEPLAAAGNERELRRDPTAHAEMLAIRAAAEALGGWRLPGVDALRDPRAVRDVRGRDRPRPHPGGRLRRRRPQGRGGGQRPRRARRAGAEPPAGGARRRAGRRVRGAAGGLLQLASLSAAEIATG